MQMSQTTQALEAAAWAAADGSATPEQLAILEVDPGRWRDVVEDLLEDIEDRLDSVRQLTGPERTQVVADFEAELAQLEAAYDLLSKTDDPIAAIAAADPAGEVRLQAWAAARSWLGRGPARPRPTRTTVEPAEAIGGPAVGWSVHPDVVLPGGACAALSIPVGEALGWLVAVGGGLGRGRGRQRACRARAVAAVRPSAAGDRPHLPGVGQPDGRAMDLKVTCPRARRGEIAAMAAAMPGPVTVLPTRPGT